MRRPGGLAGWVLLAALLWLIAYPLALVLVHAVRGADGWTLEYVWDFLGPANEWRALWDSLWISVASVVLSALIGVPLAFLFARYEFPGRRLLGAVVALPAVLPPLVGVLAFLFLYGESGFVAHLVKRVAGARRGAVAAGRRRGHPAGARVLDVRLLLSLRPRGLACSMPRSTRRRRVWGPAAGGRSGPVVLPLLRPSLAGAALLTFMTSLASFSAPYIFGGGFRVMTTQIVATRLNGDDRSPWSRRCRSRCSRWSASGCCVARCGPNRRPAGRARRPRGAGRRPRRARLLAVLAWALAAAASAPAPHPAAGVVRAGRYLDHRGAASGVYAGQLRDAGQDPVRARPLLNSLWMAIAATVAAVGSRSRPGSLAVRRRVASARRHRVAAGASVGGAGHRLRHRPRHRVQRACAVPARFILVGTLWILPLAYLVRNLPITGRAFLAGFRAAGSLARRGGRDARGRPLAHLSAGDASAAPARAGRRRDARVRHRASATSSPPSCSTPMIPGRSRSRSCQPAPSPTSAWRRRMVSC